MVSATDALAARAAGFSIIPTDGMTKRPMLGEWGPYQDAPADEQTILEWWKHLDEPALAIITGSVSKIVVVDVDEPGEAGLEIAIQTFGETSRIVRTPRGGHHLYYRHPGHAVGNAVKIPGFDFAVDLRGDGGYVLCPPSPGYQWVKRGEWSKIPIFPGVPQANLSGVAQTIRQDWTELIEGVEQGERNDALARLVGKMLQEGMRPEWVTLAAEAFGARCRPPMDRAEVARTIESIATRHAAAHPDQEDLEHDRDEEDDRLLVDRLELPAIARRGSFAGFIEYLAPVTGAAPAHAFASWLAALAVCIGPRRYGTWSGRVVPLFYNVLAGWTGDHKSSAADRAMELLPESILRVDGATSDAGLFDALEGAEGRSAVLHFDELGFLLEMASLSGSTLNPMLNRLWNAPRYLDRNLSQRTKNGGARRIERPFVGMLACTQPETFWGSLGDDRLAIASGFVNRLAVFAVDGRKSRSLARTQAPNEMQGESLRAHLELMTSLEPAEVRLDAMAEKVWDEFSRNHDDRIAKMDHIRASIAKRIRDHVARLALVFAVDEDRTIVAVEDLDAAIEVGGFLEQSYRRLLIGRQTERGPARASSLEQIIHHLLSKRPGIWHSARDLRHSWPNASRPGSDEIRRTARAMDGVEIQPGSGNRKDRFRVPPHTAPPT